MAIVLARIDDRLIHGQVMTSWVNVLGANKIVVIDDVTARDGFLTMAIKALVPSNLTAVVCTMEECEEVLKGQGDRDRIILLAKTPEPFVYLKEHGILLDEINIGGMGIKKGRRTIYKNISASEEELLMLWSLVQGGARVFIQMVAENPRVELLKVVDMGKVKDMAKDKDKL